MPADKLGMLKVRGKADPTCFWGEGSWTRAPVHGDGFVVEGRKRGVEKVKSIKEWYEVRVRPILGQDVDHDKETVVLGRTLRWAKCLVELEADERHDRLISEYVGSEPGSNSLVSPAVRMGSGDGEGCRGEVERLCVV